MLLWLVNLDLAGSERVFFVSGAIPILAAASISISSAADVSILAAARISISSAADIPVNYEAGIEVPSSEDVGI